MRRTLFNLTIAFLAFGIGSLIDFDSFWEREKTNVVIENKTKKIVENVGIGFGTGSGNEPLNNAYTPKIHKPTCSNKKLLPLWNELKKDKEFKEREKGGFSQTGDCSELIEVERRDLNSDGQKEFIIWGKYDLAGGTGNSIIWIYEKRNDKYKQLLQSYAFRESDEKWFEIKQDKTRNYHNLLLKGHFTASETTHSFFKFNGSRYIENKCWFEIWVDEKTQVTMNCKEYSEQTEKELRESKKMLKSN